MGIRQCGRKKKDTDRSAFHGWSTGKKKPGQMPGFVDYFFSSAFVSAFDFFLSQRGQAFGRRAAIGARNRVTPSNSEDSPG